MSKKYWLGLGIVAALLLFFCNGSLLVTDSVESNYALTAKEMVLSGDWVSPRIYGHYWYDKPIMFYWLTALGFKLFGFTEFGARFFPAVFGLLGLGLVCYGGYRLYNEKVGFYSGVLLLSSVEFFLISKSIITDAVLFFFFSATLLFFYLGYSENRPIFWYLMYASAGLAVLTKGPIGVLLPGLIITLFLLWQRDWRVLTRCKLVSGTALCALVAAPWYAAMYALHGSDFINTFFGVHNVLRATVSEHPRDNVWYYYLLVNILALFPWSALVPMCIWRRGRSGAGFTTSEKFLLLWAAVVFFFFQAMATKYITYTYPLLFPMSIFLAKEVAAREEQLLNTGYYLFVGSFFALLLGAALWVSVTGIVVEDSMFLIPLSLMLGIMLYYLLQMGEGRKAIGLASLCLCFYLALITTIAVPLSEKRSAKDLGQLLVADGSKEVGLYGKYPTSAVFYSNARIVKLVPERELESYKPKNMSWSSKNVMPFAAIEKQKYPLVIVQESNIVNFKKQDQRPWKLQGHSSSWLLLHSAGKAGVMDNSPVKSYNNTARLTAKNDWRNQNGRT
ncbi:MAG: glycosyltransferase family 39 protein [Phascolarctobacterium sp.]|nr:glycosyltransferase family 39 protein [Phascolarctobacterium sp.]